MEHQTPHTIYAILDRHIAVYQQEQASKYQGIVDINEDYQSISKTQLINYSNKIIGQYNQFCAISLDDCVLDVKDEFLKEFTSAVGVFNKEMSALEKQLADEIQACHEAKEQRVQAKLEEADKYLQSLYDTVSDLIARQKNLISKKSRIMDIMKMYNLNPSAYEIDTSKLSKEEIEELYTLAEYALTVTVDDKKISDKLISFLYYPITKPLEDEKDNYILVTHFLALALLAYVTKPYFFGIVGFMYIARFLGNLFKVKDREKLLSLAYSMCDEIDLTKGFENDPKYLKLLEEAQALEEEDIREEIEFVELTYETKIKSLKSDDPTHAFNVASETYVKSINDIESYLEEATIKAFNDYNKHKSRYRTHLDEVKEYLANIRDNWRFLGEEVTRRKTMDLDFRTAYLQSNGEKVFEEFAEVPLHNIAFKYKNQSHREELLNYMKLLLCNSLMNVREKHLKVTIYDKEDLGRDFNEFYDPTIRSVVEFKTDDFNKMLNDEIIPGLRENVSKMGKKTIQEYNAEAESVGRTTEDYNIIIVLSTDDEPDISSNRNLKPLMEYSAKYGYWFWVVGKDEILIEEKRRKELSAFYKGMAICKEPHYIDFPSGYSISMPEQPGTAYQYSSELGLKCIATLGKAIEENKFDSLDYETGFRIPNIPDDKVWTYSTRSGIELKFGLEEGDPTKATSLVLGDDCVHCLMAGATGQGKSATINQILANLLHMYPPEELELVMVDFKNVEFSMYTGDLLIPHAKIIAGTKDGEYAISIFEYLMEEMERRTKLFAANKVQKLEEYNDLMEQRGTPEKILPRILLLIDEFQVMFTEVDDKSKDIIKEKITSLSKLARFCGCHMWFTSQSMKGTMSQDILDQFKLRAALYCSKDTSTDLIGNDDATRRIKTKGWIMSNTNAAQDPAVNKLWRIPFASNEYIKLYLPKLIKKGRDEGRVHRQAEFYDEDKRHKGSELKDLYDKNPKLKSEEGMLILGERTSYSKNRLPINFKLMRDDGEHVLATAFERTSLLNLSNTFIENIQSREDNILVVHTADKDSLTLLGLEQRLPDRVKPFLDTKLTIGEICDFLEHNINAREADPELCNKEMYFMGINWEKLENFGRNADFKMIDKFKLLMQRASLVNIHFIILMRDSKEIRPLVSIFNHRIASYTSEYEAMLVMENSKASKIKPHFAYYQYGSSLQKFKLYQFELYGKVAEREVVIEY